MSENESTISSTAKILIIDDDPVNQLLISQFLADSNYSVLVAENGETGLAFAGHLQPDIILLDINMPGIDGFEVCRELKAADATKDIPVIFMTADSKAQSRIMGFELGAVDYVIKPLLRQELQARIDNHLQVRKIAIYLKNANASMEQLVKKRTMELEEVNTELQKTSSFYSQMINSIDEGVVVYGPDLKYKFINPFMERLSGFNSDEVVGRSTLDIFPHLRAYGVQHFLEKALNGEHVPALDIFFSIRSTWCSVKYSPIYGIKGETLGVIGIVSDISERKRFEEKLRKFSSIIEQMPETIVITDTVGTIEYVNPSFSELTGYTFEEAIGQNPRILKSNDMPGWVYTELWDTVSSGHTWKGELHNRKKNGELFWERAVISPFRDNDGSLKGYIAIKEDITQHKILQRQLEQSQKMEAIGLLAGGIAHDFNNLLTVIHGFSKLIQMDLDVEDPNHENLSEVITAAERAGELTNSLLAFSRKQVLSINKIEIKSVVNDVGKLLRRIIGEDINLEILFRNDHMYVDIDRTQISQVLINLATNARDAMPGGGRLTIEAGTVEFNGSESSCDKFCNDGNFILLKVSDTGSGMEAETLNKIFEPFYTSKYTGKGTGLGLSIVYGVVKQHNGHIRVESKPGQGSVFYVYLPVSKSDTYEKQMFQPGPLKGRADETILVADDEEGARSFLYKLLSRYGYKVILAEDGLDAVNRFETNREQISMVLLDVMMPGISGKEALDRMRRTEPNLKALFLSGYDAGLLQNKYEMQGEYELLSKPVYAETLLKKIREILE